MPVHKHILLIERHSAIRDVIADYMKRQNLQVSVAADAADAQGQMQERHFDLVVLDLLTPQEDGLALCRRIVEEYRSPVILLTAMNGSAGKVAALDSGADDCIVKPVDPCELAARIRSVLRRWHRAPAPPPEHADTERLRPTRQARNYAFDEWTFDLTKRELRGRHGRPVMLSSVEYRLLRVLAEHPRTVLSRDRLLDLTAGSDAQSFDRSIDSQVSRLRKKLEPDPRRPSLLKTIWGDGYLFAADVRIEGGAGMTPM
ncbi:response regulator [Herbaspirillum lusitanum]|uniref:Response regulator n=1 Tax=Herbaspirillum lusitanum TaxID=213312 RepID=A0ABW9A2A0_9BURK